MRTTNKIVVHAMREHVLDIFRKQAQDELGANVKNDIVTHKAMEMLRDQIDYMQYNDRPVYRTALDYVEGGSGLIYHYEVKEFLNALGINETGKEYSDDKSWRLYCHLFAREMTRLYENAGGKK